jgi:hypothetical protein
MTDPAMSERAAVVALIRREIVEVHKMAFDAKGTDRSRRLYRDAVVLENIVIRIDRGEHLKERPK